MYFSVIFLCVAHGLIGLLRIKNYFTLSYHDILKASTDQKALLWSKGLKFDVCNKVQNFMTITIYLPAPWPL